MLLSLVSESVLALEHGSRGHALLHSASSQDNPELVMLLRLDAIKTAIRSKDRTSLGERLSKQSITAAEDTATTWRF